jgi:hypothetical protein
MFSYTRESDCLPHGADHPARQGDKVKIVAFLQNMWVRPHQVQTVIRWSPTSEQRERMIEYSLFAGCRSGQVLKRGLGDDLCSGIRWQEASPVVADNPMDYHPPDPDHIKAVLEKHRPQVVLCFTKTGETCIRQTVGDTAKFISCLHPAYRRRDKVMESLAGAKAILDMGFPISAKP